jgi:hypothetical protein
MSTTNVADCGGKNPDQFAPLESAEEIYIYILESVVLTSATP